MQIFTNLKDWWQHVYSIQLILLLIALIYLVNHLYREAEQMNERRFVWLSVVAGVVGFLVIGAAFRTPLVASMLDLPKGAIVEQTLYWIKGGIALSAAGLSIY